MTNKGSAYNTADGVFTAPRAGNFLFIWNSETNADHQCYLHLYKNGNSVDLAAYSNGYSADNDNSDGGSMSVVLELTTGDRVWVRTAPCGYLYGGPLISFTGCQLWLFLVPTNIYDVLTYTRSTMFVENKIGKIKCPKHILNHFKLLCIGDLQFYCMTVYFPICDVCVATEVKILYKYIFNR